MATAVNETEGSIQERLRIMFSNHKYILTNTYVFAWESDFFSVTDAGYIYEVEVKISRSDFKSDFGKDKHLYLKALHSGKKYLVRKSNRQRGWEGKDIICTVQQQRLEVDGKWVGHKWVEHDMQFTHEEDSFGYWHRHDRSLRIHTWSEPVKAPSSSVEITELTKKNVPNRFFYAVPIGMLQPHEVPAYAGLIYIDGHRYQVVKQAPFITKENVFARLHRVLMDKFYWLANNQRFELNQLRYKQEQWQKQKQ